jgi:hypothetical protein
LLNFNNLNVELINEQDHSKNLTKIITNLAELMSKLSATEAEKEYIDNYNESVTRMKVLEGLLTKNPINKQTLTEIEILSAV